MHRPLLRTGALFLALCLVSSGEVWAQIDVGDVDVEMGGRLHFQAAQTSADGAPGLDLFLRRARLTLDVTLNEWLSARFQPEFTGGVETRDIYVRLTLSEALRIDMGQFKRAFDLFVLTSSTEIEEVERDGRIPGLSGEQACAGIGNTCALTRFSEKLDFANRDVGIRIGGGLGERLSYQATLTNGTGIEQGDENGAKSGAGRLVYALTESLHVGGNFSIRDFEEAEETRQAVAWGGDLEWGGLRTPGIHARLGVVGGDNWKNLDPGGDPSTFVAVQSTVAWYRPVEPRGPLVAIQPLGRISWGDPNTDLSNDGGLLLTPGFALFFGGRNKLAANLDIYSPGTGDTEVSLKVQTFVHF